MKKRIRSRVLAAGMISSTFVVGTGLLSGGRALGQDRPSAADTLARGSRLYDQKQYGEAKKLLLDIDPAQLPEEQRAKLNDLLKNTDIQIAKGSTSGGFDEAQAALDADHYAQAAQGFQGVLDNAAAPADAKDKAKIQLALVKQKQAEKVPQMRELLNQADSLYDQGKLDEAQNAVTTVQNVGADLGWRDNARPAALSAKIAEKRTAMARGGAGGMSGGMSGTVQVAAPGDNTTMMAPPGGTMAPAGANGMSAAEAALNGAPNPGGATIAPPGVSSAPAASGSGGALDDYASRLLLEHDRAINLYNQALKQSNDAISSNPPQYAAAVDKAQQAVGYINEAYGNRYLSDTEATDYRNRAQQQLNLATSAQQVYNKQQADKAAVDARVLNNRRLAQLDGARHKRIDELLAQADHFYSVQQYRECANTLEILVSIDPQNANAKLYLTLVNDRIQNFQYQDLLRQRSRETVRQGILSNEELIPYADLMVYPDDWVELSRRRLGDLPDQESAANRSVRSRLDEELNDITAEQQGFEKVIGYLQNATGTNIIVNWKALEGAGIDRNAAVTINLKKVPFRKALTEILNEVGGATAALAYTIDDGVISISTKDDLTSQKYQTIRVFDIRDMLVQPDNTSQPPSFNLQQVTQGSGGGSGGGGGSQGSIFQTSQTATGPTTAGAQAVVTEIVDTIQTIVAPDSWREKGGSIGSIRELNGQLIVNQTADNQTAVYNLLQQLRETRAIQISVEARLLLVSNNFLDDFGFGWSLSIPAGALGGNVGALTVGNNTDTQAVAPSTGVPGSLGGGAIANPSLTVSGSIIDNYQLSLFLRATQADQRTVTVTAPRVTLFNGQRGYIAVTAQRNYISNFNQTVAAGGINGAAAVATTLTVSTLSTGITLLVQATASADRRYVVMQITPQLATLDGIDTFSSAPSGTSANAAGTLAIIQLPRVSFTTINTMVSIPDGGTLLIGGQKLVGESEIEIGVPVLSKIPGLNRLFTNRNVVKDERTLLILVRPKIIIQKEIETNLFGTGYERSTGLPTGQSTPGAPSQSVNPSFSIGSH